MSQNRKQAKPGLSVSTLMIASLSSLAAAVVVSRLWGGGTLIGAAMTPVIVALVSEGLNRPAKVIGTVPKAIGTVRPTRGGRYDPVAEGRAGLREGDFDGAGTPPLPAAAAAQIRVHRASTTKSGFSLRMPRPRVLAAIGTGLVAFLIAAVFLTSSELVLGESVTSSSHRTTLVPVNRSTSSSTTKDKTDTTKTTDTTTTPTTSTATTDHAAGREHPGAERDDAGRPARAAAADRARGAAAGDDGPGRAADHDGAAVGHAADDDALAARPRASARSRARRAARASTSGSSSIATRSCVERVAVAQRDRAVLERLVVDRDARTACRSRPGGGSACRSSRPRRTRPASAAQQLVDLARELGLAVLAHAAAAPRP